MITFVLQKICIWFYKKLELWKGVRLADGDVEMTRPQTLTMWNKTDSRTLLVVFVSLIWT